MTNVISFEMDKTAAWRQKKAERYPEDVRNQAAVSILKKLSSQTADPDLSRAYEYIWNEIEPDKFGEIHSEILGQIGFSLKPDHVDEVLTLVIEQAKEHAS